MRAFIDRTAAGYKGGHMVPFHKHQLAAGYQLAALQHALAIARCCPGCLHVRLAPPQHLRFWILQQCFEAAQNNVRPAPVAVCSTAFCSAGQQQNFRRPDPPVVRCAACRALNRTLILPQMWCWCDQDADAAILDACINSGTEMQLPFRWTPSHQALR